VLSDLDIPDDEEIFFVVLVGRPCVVDATADRHGSVQNQEFVMKLSIVGERVFSKRRACLDRFRVRGELLRR